MTKHVCTTLLISCCIGFGVLPAAEQDVPKTVEEAKALRDKFFEEAKHWGKFPPPMAQAGRPVFLLRFLDSDNPAIRAVAIEAFSQIGQMNWSSCLPYIEPHRPLQERIPVLILCIRQFGGHVEAYYSGKGVAEQIRLCVKEVLKSDVCPLSFAQLTVQLAYDSHFNRTAEQIPITAMVEEVDRAIVAKRFLAGLSKVMTLYPQKKAGDVVDKENQLVPVKVFEMVIALGEKNTGAVVEEWYRVEANAATRGVVVEESLSWSKSPEWAARRKAVLELASKDWDQTIAAKAKVLLSK